VKTIRVRKEYFTLITSGEKTCEVRCAHPLFDAVSPKERIRFVCGKEEARARVDSVRRYTHLLSLVLWERAGRILPGANKAEIYRVIRSIYPREKRRRGFVVIDFELTGPVIPTGG